MTGLFEVYMSSVVYTAVVCALVVLFIIVRVRRYNRYMRDNYSYTERINVQWLMNSMAILAVCLLSWLYVCTNVSHLGDMFYYISSTVLWAVVLYYSMRQEWIPQAQDMESEETGVSRNFVSQMGGKLEEYIREKELYLNPKLSLSDLAVEMGTNRSYLSNCLNNELGITFYDYINSFRLEKAKEILDDSGFEGCIEDVAIRSGFNSVSTFRRSFQKKYGCTPSQYRKNALGHR